MPSWGELKVIAERIGIDHVGVAPAEVLTRARRELHRRVDEGLSAGMGFTYRNPDRSTDPQRAVDGARSIIVAAMPYGALDAPTPPSGASGRVARYAWIDYYTPLRLALKQIALVLRASGERAVVFADDNSIVDREVAYLGGLGWFGKNANLLVPGGGSYFVLGSIVTTAYYAASTPVSDGCGTCERCISGCPTGAIVEPGVIDGNRCLAWLVQRPGTFPSELRAALGDRFYGCDDCQEVCPPATRLGAKLVGELPELDPHGDAQPPQAWVDVIEVLTATDDELIAKYGRWYLAGRDPRWWRRNALIVAGNVADPSDRRLRARIDHYRSGDDELLAEHALWALARLDERARGSAVPVALDSSPVGRP